MALQLRRSEVIGSVEVGMLDVLEKADMVRGRLAKYSKKLDESAFNNQVPWLSISVSCQHWCHQSLMKVLAVCLTTLNICAVFLFYYVIFVTV